MVNRVFKCSLLGCARLCVHMDFIFIYNDIYVTLQGQIIKYSTHDFVTVHSGTFCFCSNLLVHYYICVKL